MIECFTFDLKFETYFLTENIFSQKTMILVLVTYQEKIRVLFHKEMDTSILYDLHSTFKFTQRRAKLKYAFIGKVAKKARIFFMYCFSVRFEFFQETSIHRKSRGQARIIVMYVYKNSPIFLLFYWFRYRFYRFFCTSINLMLQKTK